MAFRKSAGIIIFRRKDKTIYYLVLDYGHNYWGFAKGHIESGESLKDTALREAKEETGLENIELKEGFKEWNKYFFRMNNENIFKVVTYFLGESNEGEIKISDEHQGYQWLTYKKALGRISFKNARRLLEKAHNFIQALDNEEKEKKTSSKKKA